MKMTKADIKRSDLRRNFLKEVIMRLDFQGVFQPEMENILIKIKPYLREHSFTRYDQKITNQIMASGDVPDLKSEMVHVFTNESSGYMVELSTSNIVLTVSSQAYSPFEDYSQVFSHLADVYRQNIDFFTVQRFGLRKINVCFVKDKKAVSKYFSQAYYNCEEPILGFSTNSVIRRDTLSDNNRNINMNYAVEEGKIGEESIYKITLDTDIYLTSKEDIEQTVFEEVALNDLNEIIFKIYINVITDELIGVLSKDESPSPEEIMGVDDNA